MRTRSNRVSFLKKKLSNSIGFPFRHILTETMIQQELEAEGVSYRKRLYTPIITLWIWLCQVIDKDKSCKNAISRIVSYLVAQGETPPSTDTGALTVRRASDLRRDSFYAYFAAQVSIYMNSTKRSCGVDTVSSLLMVPP